MRNRFLLGLLPGVALLLPSSRAEACGGFFCSQTPVLQTAERIVFGVEKNEVVAYVQLTYQGNDPNFAWIVPVPDTPTVETGVGQAMFDALEDETHPVFVGGSGGMAEAFAARAPSGCSAGFGAPIGDPKLSVTQIPVPKVNVAKSERVGPYDVAVLSAVSAADLNTWLRINGYRVQPASEPIVQEYLQRGMKLLALKLSPTSKANQVEPIKLSYTSSVGCATIPIRLTAIAAAPGLEIVTWVFSESRAVPENYQSVELDTRTLTSSSGYGKLLSTTIDQKAGGHGFVTEFAQRTEHLSARGDPILEALIEKHGYVTRLRTVLDPKEMTIDPSFKPSSNLPDVSNQITLGRALALSTGSLLSLVALGLVVRRRRS
jgi:hypothetical protein